MVSANQKETKSDLSPVTIADRSVETALRGLSRNSFPQIQSGRIRSDDRSDPVKGPPALIDGS